MDVFEYNEKREAEEMKMTNSVSGLAVLLLGGSLIYGIGVAYLAVGKKPVSKTIPKTIPVVEHIQKGYIAPGKLEIIMTDLDKNGELETVMKVGKDTYLLREINGKPVLSEYVEGRNEK